MIIHKLLFAVDNSICSRKAIELTEMMGEANKNLIVYLVHVLEPIPTLIGSPDRERIKAEMARPAQQLLDEYKDELNRRGIRAETVIEQGDIANRLLSVAETQKCDLVIMGARGQSSLEEILLGSVSQKVLQYSKIPVLIAR